MPSGIIVNILNILCGIVQWYYIKYDFLFIEKRDKNCRYVVHIRRLVKLKDNFIPPYYHCNFRDGAANSEADGVNVNVRCECVKWRR